MIVTEKRVFVIKKCGVVVTDKHSSSDGLAPIQMTGTAYVTLSCCRGRS
jgi:hypothetical protein